MASIRFNLLIVIALCALSAYPTTSISRYFSSSYQDLRVTLKRYGNCVGELPALKDSSFNETEFLMQQMKNFLNQANLDNEQLANVSLLMDNICRSDLDSSYPISVNIDVNKYTNGTGKDNRCRAIDEALDSMYSVFRRATLNRSEPLDFSVIQFYPIPSNKAVSYNLTDLINTSWIKSETILEHVCKITDSVKEYVQLRTSNSIAQDRAGAPQASHPSGMFTSLLDLIDRILDPIFGLRKRLYWESNNRLELGYARISSTLGAVRDGIGNSYKSTRGRLSGLFVASNSTSKSVPANATSLTSLSGLVNSTAAAKASSPATTLAPSLTLATAATNKTGTV